HGDYGGRFGSGFWGFGRLGLLVRRSLNDAGSTVDGFALSSIGGFGCPKNPVTEGRLSGGESVVEADEEADDSQDDGRVQREKETQPTVELKRHLRDDSQPVRLVAQEFLHFLGDLGRFQPTMFPLQLGLAVLDELVRNTDLLDDAIRDPV